jgi:hypothetical protein
MSNLGDSNTPVEGQSFGLPAGAELGEDNGDVVIKDSSGTIILRRNETASEWQFEGTDLSGINAIDASSATFSQSINGADIANAAEAEALKKTASGTGLEFSPIEAGVDYQFDTFTASGTWDKPVGINFVRVDVISAGGGGAANNSGGYGGGGGGGGRIVETIPADAVPASVSIQVGAGGSGASGSGNGGSGGSSSFGTIIEVTGGGGGDSGGVPGYGGGGWNQEDADFLGGYTEVLGTGLLGGSPKQNENPNAEWGGGAGGYSSGSGGGSWRGAGGGGGSSEFANGGAAGTFFGRGGAGNAPGGNGSDGDMISCGEGGGGNDAGNNAGNGGFPGGGGGGAKGGGDAGDGANGAVRVWFW